MASDKHNAALHMIKNPNKAGLTRVGKSGEYVEAGRFAEEKKLIENVELCNFCQIVSPKTNKKKCLCGGIYDFTEGLQVKYRKHRKDEMRSVVINGKQCRDCGRMLLCRPIILSAIREDGKS